jgi:hypothetical protein
MIHLDHEPGEGGAWKWIRLGPGKRALACSELDCFGHEATDVDTATEDLCGFRFFVWLSLW